MRALHRALTAAAATLVLTATAAAQVIPIKTVPVATGDQFLVFPSDRLGMASVSIALEDSLGDPFSNPATLARLDAPRLFGSPTAYGITDGNGSAITLPAGAFVRSSDWRTGFAMALQELHRADRPDRVFPTFADVTFVPTSPDDLDQRSRTNLYGFVAAARPVTDDGRTRIGGSLFVADLRAVGGVDFLYSSRTVDQRGTIADVRLGLETRWGDGRRLEAVLVHNRFAMDHEFQELVWTRVPEPGVPPEQWVWEPRTVINTELDRTNTWGVQLDYSVPMAAAGWRVGGRFTGNRKSHPKIPNYTLMSIPRDPGTSWAYQLGAGVSKRTDGAVFGLDVIYEPVWTETWADAAEPVVTVDGVTIPAGDMTVFNDFRFQNAIIRAGLTGHGERTDLQFGLQLKRYGYTLDQHDRVADRRRRQTESWLEWTPSFALAVRFDDFSIRYTGRLTAGTGRPGVNSGGVFPTADASFNVDYLPAPSGSLTLDDALVHTHQVSVSIPF